jgi:DNA polymerase-3 subunit alpha
LANVITSIIDDDSTVKDIFKRSVSEPKLKEYVKNNSDIFYMMEPILGQNKTQSIHACAIIVFPKVMQTEEYVPVRKQKGLTVTEWNGGELDNAGFLKSDVLGILQLDKYKSTLKLIESNGKQVPDIYNLPLDDSEVFRFFGNGWNGDVFQFGTELISGYTRYMKPETIEDLIAVNALQRPGPMENGYPTIYAKCKNEGKKVEYLWGTEQITKDTFGLLVYQEQIMEVCQKIGGLSKVEADDVRRAMGKKDLKYLSMWKDRLWNGFKEKGATQSEFEKAWDVMMEFAKYSFNKSHSAAYSLEGYICQYLKVHYPLEFWTVALGRASESNVIRFLSEINSSKGIEIFPPDINVSGITMTESLDDNAIFWGIESIKGIGETTAEQIIKERESSGQYKSLEDFIERHGYKGSKVKKGAFESLIACGAFDKMYGLKDVENGRANLIKEYRLLKKVKITAKALERDPYTIGKLESNWWWKLRQKNLSGIATVDYKAICEELGVNMPFASGSELSTPQKRGIDRAFGGYVVECRARSSSRGRFATLTIESNYKTYKVMLWNDTYEIYKHLLKNIEKSFVVFTGELKYDERWARANQFTLQEEYST